MSVVSSTFTCMSVVPVASRIVNDLDGGSGRKSASALLVTIWELGEAAGPLLIAPLSEVFGRYPLMNAANVMFITATALAAMSQSTTLLIATRALTGFAVASNVLNPAIVGDMFHSEQRGTAMSLIMFAPLIGGAVGPAIGGAVTETLGWRAVLWISAILACVCEVVFLTYFRETYKVPILRRRAARLREEAGNTSLTTVFGKPGSDEKSLSSLRTSVVRPAVVLFGSGVLMALSLFGSVVFAYFYVLSVTLPDILEQRYALSPALTGSAFLSNSKLAWCQPTSWYAASRSTCTHRFHIGVGSFISVMICNLYLDKIYVGLRASNKGVDQPEYRLPVAIVSALTLPPAVALYGWCAEYRLPLPLLLLSVVWIGLSLMLAILPLMAYVVDACGLYAASALTGVIVTRCLAGTFLPLTTAPLIENLGYGWGFTVLAALGLSLAPIPLLIFRYGPIWRQRSKYTRTM